MSAYPYSPGHRGIDTSMEAANRLARSLGLNQRKVLEAIRVAGMKGLTSEELAAVTGLSYATVQPRTSELKLLGLIRDSGLRRPNASGCRAKVWIVTNHAAQS